MEKGLEKTVSFVKSRLENAEAGHDWWHILRVLNNSEKIAKEYPEANMRVIQLSALLHDIADAKFHAGDEEVGIEIAREHLQELDIPTSDRQHILNIMNFISYKGGFDEGKFDSLEFRIIQDADRLDALGAIGIARTFSYGGYKGNPFFDPAIPPNMNMSREEYKKSNAPTVNHFYEKLFLLRDLMKTQKGKEMAEERHQFMELYLQHFYTEWGLEKPFG